MEKINTFEIKNSNDRDFSYQYFDEIYQKAQLDLEDFLKKDKEIIDNDPENKKSYKSSETKRQEKLIGVLKNKLELIKILDTQTSLENDLYKELSEIKNEDEIRKKEHDIEISQEVINYLKDYIVNKVTFKNEYKNGMPFLNLEGYDSGMVEEVIVQIDLIKKRMSWN